ncbi:leucine-rich repeat-containing protein 74B-like [Dreissena polymorpha]|uniref:leucine-rich repeat-containing protein 74B-like n=1 Tax=Dreissena polymorpha TaxID=45954 RepID=UPI00226476D3|nr:leucine-rich repeat-containing protein 74B-like [Dreissena polymorpha]
MVKLYFQFNDWDLIRRSNVDCGYKKVLRFRSAIYPAVKSRAMTLTPAKVSRRPKGTLSASLLDSGDRNSSLSGSIDHFDPDQFFKGEFDFDAEEPEEPPLYPHLVHKPGTYAQEMYLKACRLQGITRSARCYKMLAGEAVVLPRQGLGPDDVKACAIALAETMNIHTLDFTENMIGTKGAEYIALLITENNFIKNLNLADNNLGPDAVKLIADSVKKTDSLSSISLAGNGLSGTRCVAVKSLIEDSLNLKVLDLSNNDLGDVGVDIVAESLAFNDTIERLDLGNNQVTNITKLAQTLSKNTGLVQLNLSSNGLHVSGCRDLARALEKNTTLRELNLAKNRIDRACLNNLFGGLKKNAFLRVLKIDFNPLNSEDAMHVLTFITENPAIGLSHIYMDSIDVQANFVQTLNTLKQAREITITYGKIIGTDLGIHDLDEALVLEATDFVVFEELSRVIGLDIENFVKDQG